MAELSEQITNVLLRVAADLGHGGHLSEYRIDSDKDGCMVKVSISSPFMGPGRSEMVQ